GEHVAATTAPNTSPYTVPMLDIPGFRRGHDTKLSVHFPELNDARANIFLEPRKDGPVEVRIRFHSLTRVPADKRIVVWAVGPDGSYAKLGQIVNTRSEEHTSELQSPYDLVCRLLLEKKKNVTSVHVADALTENSN